MIISRYEDKTHSGVSIYSSYIHTLETINSYEIRLELWSHLTLQLYRESNMADISSVLVFAQEQKQA